MAKAKKLTLPETWWSEVRSGKRSYKKPADSDKAIGLLKFRGWKLSDVERAKVLMEAYFRDSGTVPPTFYNSTRKSGEAAATLTRTLKAAGKQSPRARTELQSDMMQEIERLTVIVQARSIILGALVAAHEKNIPGLDLSEMQSVVNELIINSERLAILNGGHGVVPALVGKRTPITKNAAPAPPEEKAAASEVAPQGQDNGALKPPGFSGWKKNTPLEREIFQRTRPKS